MLNTSYKTMGKKKKSLGKLLIFRNRLVEFVTDTLLAKIVCLLLTQYILLQKIQIQIKI